jgi:hypothetical protein
MTEYDALIYIDEGRYNAYFDAYEHSLRMIAKQQKQCIRTDLERMSLYLKEQYEEALRATEKHLAYCEYCFERNITTTTEGYKSFDWSEQEYDENFFNTENITQ